MTVASRFLSGARLYLRPLCEADADGPYVTWFDDGEVCRGNSHHVFPYTREAALQYIQYSRTTRDALILAIVLHDGDKHVGNIALQTIHPVYRSAELVIILGDKSVWGQGYAKEAARLLCDHGFGAINLHRIACGTFEGNIAMQKVAAHLGMQEEGRRRQAAYKDGRYLDIIEYGVLEGEYVHSVSGYTIPKS